LAAAAGALTLDHPAPLRAEVAVALAETARRGGDLPGAAAAVASAAAAIDEGAPWLGAHAALVVGAIAFTEGRRGDARVAFERARSLAVLYHDRDVEGRAYNGLGLVEELRPDLAVAWYERSAEALDELGIAEAFVPRLNLAEQLLALGRLAEATVLLEELRAWATGRTDAYALANVNALLASLFRLLGDASGAVHHAQMSLEIAARHDFPFEGAVAYHRLVEVAWEAGRVDDAARYAAAMREGLLRFDEEGLMGVAEAWRWATSGQGEPPDPTAASPGLRVGMALAVARGWAARGRPDRARAAAQGVLAAAETLRYDGLALQVTALLAEHGQPGAAARRDELVEAAGRGLDPDAQARFIARWRVAAPLS
jgi:hypothetical protein